MSINNDKMKKIKIKNRESKQLERYRGLHV